MRSNDSLSLVFVEPEQVRGESVLALVEKVFPREIVGVAAGSKPRVGAVGKKSRGKEAVAAPSEAGQAAAEAVEAAAEEVVRRPGITFQRVDMLLSPSLVVGIAVRP